MKKQLALAAVLGFAFSGTAFATEEHVGKKVDKHFEMMDTNKDGSISKEEHNAGGEKMFAKADANSDGMVTKQEMIDMKKKEWKEWKDEDGIVKKDGTKSH